MNQKYKYLLFLVVLMVGVSTSGCSLYKRTMIQKDLVDGAKAYSMRRFEEAENKLRYALERDPELDTDEAKLAEKFLANTLQSQYIIDRTKVEKADEALKIFQGIVERDAQDIDSFRALSSLIKDRKGEDEWMKLVITRSENDSAPNASRAEAYATRAGQEYSCANTISSDKNVRRQVGSEFKYSKPSDPKDLEKLTKCVKDGTALIERAVELLKEVPKESIDQLSLHVSVWSYRVNFIGQQARIEEMLGENAKRDALKKDEASAREIYEDLNKRLQDERIKKTLQESSIDAAKDK
jgi:hypothetical protein